MNQVYRYCGYSKQGFHQKLNRKLSEQEYELLLLPIINELRQEHPGVAARELYVILKPERIGRDKFERLCFRHGFKLTRQRSYKRTTDSTGIIRFPNLMEGIELTDINQEWASDITYYQIGKKVYYLTFITDLFSRRIVGYSVSKSLFTQQTTLPALTMALHDRHPGPGLIFHSDGGGQYYCKSFLALTSKYKMKNSMCEVAYENPYAERINGTIKNQYLKGYNPRSFSELIAMTQRAVRNYNHIRPHKSLRKLTPVVYEKIWPAGGSSLSNNDFCISINLAQLNQKNYYLPKRLMKLKPVKKMVNVF